jgi:hypothetical protein
MYGGTPEAKGRNHRRHRDEHERIAYRRVAEARRQDVVEDAYSAWTNDIADEAHGKRYIISATPAGRQLFERIRNRGHRYFQTIMNGLDETDRDRLDALFETLARNVFDHRGS